MPDAAREPGEALLRAGITPMPPGVYLADYVFPHKGVTIEQAAKAMGLPEPVLRGVLENQLKVDKTIARYLSTYTGLSVGFWLDLQSAADLSPDAIRPAAH
jgi:plasmid maintenance system antidote protein VapI